MPSVRSALLLAILFVAAVAARPAPPAPAPPIPLPAPAGWAKAVDHPYFPLRPGTVFVYTTNTDRQTGTDTITVLRETKFVMGVNATVVHEREYEGGALTEDTFDWYAQDVAGNVWYLGEQTREFPPGKPANTAGSWEAGVNGAKAGIVMWASPKVGLTYRQEFRPGVAEDMARVLSLGVRVVAGRMSYKDCLLTEEWSPLERGIKEHKTYARGIGLVRSEAVAGPTEQIVLAKVIAP